MRDAVLDCRYRAYYRTRHPETGFDPCRCSSQAECAAQPTTERPYPTGPYTGRKDIRHPMRVGWLRLGSTARSGGVGTAR